MMDVVKQLEQGVCPTNTEKNIKVYTKSFLKYQNDVLIMVKENRIDFILISGTGDLYNNLIGEKVGTKTKKCRTSHENRRIINSFLEYTKPKAFGNKVATIGLGDRLGLASTGHIEVTSGKSIKPVLAQQSIRELDLTGRTMTDIIDAASFAVLKEGYTGGFGADADHIKKEEHVKEALDLGYSMITLDCSDQIKQNYSSKQIFELKEDYSKLSAEDQEYYFGKYLHKTFKINDTDIYFSEETIMRAVFVYQEALDFVAYIYKTYISPVDRDIDFELSIDETRTITTPMEHFFVANELKDRNVKLTSLAPRFCGEFQKGIDYIGDIEQFNIELKQHADIADHFHYKLSIHSGSDKFKVFPIITKHTKGLFHVKTAGTNWLEAIRVIAVKEPGLYRELHAFALNNIEEALKYYDINPDLSSIPSLSEREDDELPQYMDEDASRQLLHITYGLILSYKEGSEYVYKDKIYKCLIDEEETYSAALITHIGKHLQLLNK
ncbi:tagaturonate epimerase family protein [Virgibacillus sp. W0430]|uniref:tagaturonate epimerase family protein n=1 Tax=Virgibacillus sp. W0430 TaxID=3391580 RepID=UPI003F45219A